jgi:DNA sulfur modification protein DndB
LSTSISMASPKRSTRRGRFTQQFPALKGVQAGRIYYVLMCPLGLVTELFVFSDEDTSASRRAQRRLNQARIPALADYVISNTKEYVFSALTASVDTTHAKLSFRSLEPDGDSGEVDAGVLELPRDVKFLINDGQHRHAAIVKALEAKPNLKHETIAVVLFVDRGLRRSQQMFADLNMNAVRPTKSIGVLYDHRDDLSRLARELVAEVATFRRLTEMERTSISNRKRKLFTLSTIYFATRQFLEKQARQQVTEEDAERARVFWSEVCCQMEDWQRAADGDVKCVDLREECIHAHGVAVQAIALAGKDLVKQQPRGWKAKLKKLNTIDWSRDNDEVWDGRAQVSGRMNNSTQHVALTAIVIKQALGVRLSKNDKEIERRHGRAKA